MHMKLTDPIGIIPKTHSTTLKKLQSLGVYTVGELVQYFPSRYVDYTNCALIETLQPGDVATVRGTIVESKNTYIRRLTIQTVIIDDGTGKIKLTWFNQPYIIRMCVVGLTLAVAGEVKKKGVLLTMQPDEYEIIRDAGEGHHTGAIIPIYPQRKGLSTRLLREKIAYVINQVDTSEIEEWLPDEIVKRNHLLPYSTTINKIHHPSTMEEAQLARARISFDELFLIHLSNALVRKQWQAQKVTSPLSFSSQIEKTIQHFITNLPFHLTPSQVSSWQQILDDLKKIYPMNRFLQGDVGSGKTVVAALASYLSLLNDKSVLVMCPTEVLANQHFATFEKLFRNIPNINIRLVTGTTSKKKIEDSAKKPTVSIGTHALLSKTQSFSDIGLIIIDEQHRFGVAQRALLKEKGGHTHLLTMTATPIPRTVALTLFGDLDMSVLSDMPAGRLAVKTYVAPPEKRAGAYEWIRKQIKETKCQVFVICPRIEEDEDEGTSRQARSDNTESVVSMRAAIAEAARLKTDVFPDLRIALIHGKLKSNEKEEVMRDFKDHKYDILVSTTVIEVGIDIPNASIIVIEGAERFGLAQLHQLRGRVGRSDAQSYCVLFTSDGIPSSTRLEFFAKTKNGMELAEFDFRLRGPGNIYGVEQHGESSLKVANLFDYALVSKTKDEAEQIAAHPLNLLVQKKLSSIQREQIAKD